MADARTELADIVVPAAPEMVAAAGGGLAGWIWGGLLVVLAGCALLAWRWHRGRPARALHAIATSTALRHGSLPALAARLDAWACAFFTLPRVQAAVCPPGLDPVAWSEWAQTLEQLRFAPPQPDGYTALARLCERARGWRRHA